MTLYFFVLVHKISHKFQHPSLCGYKLKDILSIDMFTLALSIQSISIIKNSTLVGNTRGGKI